MRPRIRYCSRPAGRVAYSTWGTGPPLLFDSGWISDLRAQLELAAFGSFVERLAERFTVIRYDKPGCGLSDREGIDLSFDGQVAAALAVADTAARSLLITIAAGRPCPTTSPTDTAIWPGRCNGATRYQSPPTRIASPPG